MVTKKPKNKRSEAWLRRIQASKQILKQQETVWRRNRGLLLGRMPNNVQDWSAVNLCWAAFETLVGSAYAQNPDSIIRETRGDLSEVAKLLTTATGQDLDLMGSRKYVRLSIVDVFWAGFGLIKETLSADITNHKFSYDVDGSTYSGELPALANQRYTLSRIHPSSFLRDPVGSSADLCDHKWVAEEFFPTIKEVKESDLFTISDDMLRKLPKLYQSPALEKPLGADAPVRIGAIPDSDDEDDEFAQIRMYEVSSRVDKRIFYIPAQSDEIVGDREWPVDLIYNKELLYPVSVLFFNEHPDGSWPIPEISNIAPQLEQFSNLFHQVIKDATSKWRKFVVNGHYLQKGHMARLVMGPGNQVISIDNSKIGDPTKFRIENVVMPVPDVVQKQDTLAILGLVKNLVHEIIGAGDFASGGMRNTRSATEAAALADFMKVRMTNRTDCLDAFFREIVIRHTLFLQQTATEERMVALVGPAGQPVWKSFDKDTIQGDFVFRVISGSSQPKNTEVHRQESIAFLQQVLPLVLQSGGDITPLIYWAAPLYDIPQHLVDQIFSNHKSALLQLAQAILQSHQGVQIAPQAFLEMASTAVKTGLSDGDLKALLAQAQTQTTGHAAPVALPGTNPAQQTK